MTNHLSYPWLYDTVRARFDSDEAMEAFLPQALAPDALKRKGDDRYLSAMTQRVFQAGMQHSVVDAKWPAFEEAFAGFDPEAMAMIGAADIEHHLRNTGIIRHAAKLQTIPGNARFILDIRREHGGSFGAWIADWPVTDIIGLWRRLAQDGARLGGRSGAGFLRLAGKDTFLLTSHVVERLVLAGAITRTPSSRRDLQAVQDAFNALQQSSGRPLCQLSSMLALSIHPAF
ncbi:MAG: DNA-3-methyladenine glycosylase I [Castellaniella sp.]|uniref:DNA-3-methyladenine glycosylase I n=1 Tax=Castellaniella sp. TaxID=1955812 RepID=UPI003C755CB3